MDKQYPIPAVFTFNWKGKQIVNALNSTSKVYLELHKGAKCDIVGSRDTSPPFVLCVLPDEWDTFQDMMSKEQEFWNWATGNLNSDETEEIIPVASHGNEPKDFISGTRDGTESEIKSNLMNGTKYIYTVNKNGKERFIEVTRSRTQRESVSEELIIPASVFFVSLFFVILMLISVTCFNLHYIKRNRYTHGKDGKDKHEGKPWLPLQVMGNGVNHNSLDSKKYYYHGCSDCNGEL